ncbi:MAG: hypothetical protein JKX97_05010, partial [Candidatus Lindowbacteria bacterium]|nr:hypothetical protein [Candidatus Lindowbacteria bacterium]
MITLIGVSSAETKPIIPIDTTLTPTVLADTTLTISPDTTIAISADTTPTPEIPEQADATQTISLNVQDVEIRELVRIMGKQAGVSVYTSPSIKGKASIHVTGLSFEDALKVILEPSGYALQPFRSVGPDAGVPGYLVYDPAVARRLNVSVKNGLLSIDVQRFTLSEALAEIARQSQKSIVPSGSADVPLTLSLYSVDFENGLKQIAQAADHRLLIEGDRPNQIYRIIPGAVPPPLPEIKIAPFEVKLLPENKIKIRATNAMLAEVLLAVAEKENLSVVIGEDVKGTTTAFLNNATPEDAVRALVERAGMRVYEEAGSLIVTTSQEDRLTIKIKDGTVELHAIDAPVQDVLKRLSMDGGLPAVTFDPSVDGNVSIHLSGISTRQAFSRIVDARAFRSSERNNLIRVTDPAKESRIRIIKQGGLVTLDIQNALLRDVLKEFGSRTGVNVSASNGDSMITVTVQSLTPNAALLSLAESINMAVHETSERYRIVTLDKTFQGSAIVEFEEGKLSLQLEDAEIELLALELAKASSKNFIVETGVWGTVSGRLDNVDFERGLRTFLISKGYRLRNSKGIYRIQAGTIPRADGPAPPNLEIFFENGLISVDVTNADLGILLRQISEETDLDLALYGTVRDRINVILKEQELELAISKILAGTNLGFVIEDSTIVVGDISQPGSPMAAMALHEEVIPIQYMAAKEMLPLLPAEIPSSRVRVLESQNALLIMGRKEIIEKAIEFIREIDLQPLQVEIEALLVEYRTIDAFNHNLATITVTGAGQNAATFSPGQGGLSFTYTDLESFKNPLFQASLTSLVSDGTALIRARSSITTISGREAKINVQSQENFRITQPSTSQGVPLVQIQSITSGITLRITPYVANKGDAVTIDMFVEDSSPGDRTADGLPAIATRNAENRIVLRDSRTAVIGGLLRQDKASSTS